MISKSCTQRLPTLTPEEMATAGLSAPLHPGAAKYYKEAGIIE